MKRFFTFILCCVASLLMSPVIAQSNYYWSGGEKISLTEDRSTLVLHFQEGKIPTGAFASRNASSVDVHQEDARMIVHYPAAQVQDASQLLKTHSIDRTYLKSASFGWVLDDGFSLAMTHEVVLQYLPGNDLASIQPLLNQYGATYARTEFETVIIEVPSIRNVLPLANALRESGSTRFAHPDFYAKLTHYADPLFSEQFQMNNTGQTIDGFPGTADADCNAPEAWATTLGSSSITVAVIDDGVEDHEDLNNSGGASRLIGGYTPLTGGNGTPNASGDHGEACAGIIAASHNNLGVQGLAPEVQLLAVNIFAGSETAQDIANGVTWAKNNGADVMSNSWGYTSCTANFATLTNAINDAVNNGRGGLGCVVIFASGNGYKTCVDYPADLPSVIAVGAFGNDGIISDYSNEGPTLDITAPSNDVSAQGFLSGAGVRTIDRMGSAGYSTGNYTTTFGGTSAACPVVAGVAALVLSVDPSLTDAEVKNILYTTAIDMGSSGFDNTYGNGRVNAGGAVAAASGGGGGPSCSSTISSFPYSEGFEGGLGAWTQGSGDDLDWSRNSGGTPSNGTGPSSAAAGSWYMYVEASSPNYPSKNTLFNSPCFDMSGLSDPEISFQYHMLGNAVGTLDLEASLDGSSWTTVWTLSGTQGSSWNSTTVDLGAYAGNAEVRLRFSGTTGSSWQGDLCIDDITVENNSGGGGPSCATTISSFPYGESFEGGIGDWSQASGDDLDWTRRSGGTPSNGTGPSGASDGSFYMYVEASSPNFPSKNTIFNGPCFDLSGVSSPALSFSYHMLGNAVGTVLLEASTDLSSWTTVWSESGSQGSAWNSANVDLSSYAGTTVALRFNATTGSSWQGDICIDNLALTDGGGGGGCPTIDFNSTSIIAYGNGQDNGSFQVQDGGATLFIQNNAWKAINFPYTITANTVIEFDFQSTTQGEIHGVAFDSDLGISSNLTFKVHGTQNWGLTNYDNYSGSGWTTYTIPVGTFYTGGATYLAFIADHDGGAQNGNSYFRNVKVYEGSCAGGTLAQYETPGPAILGTEGEYSLSLYPNPAFQQLTINLGQSEMSFDAKIVDLTGRTIWAEKMDGGVNQLTIDHLSSGMYFFTARLEDGTEFTERFVKK
ncbi:MAG: S8 family serine peptidase [Bacteroidota bacterium]